MAPLKINYLRTLGIVALSGSLLLAVCCKKKDTEDPKNPALESFDKQGLLVNLADNLILPGYKDLKGALDSLTLAFNAFKTNGSQEDFLRTRSRFDQAYLKYQRICIFGFGPGEDASIRSNFNIFPPDTNKIRSNIKNGGYDLAAATNFAAKGLPALDYLFYGRNRSVEQLVEQFNLEPSRKTYVRDLLNEMSGKINTVVDTWSSSYRNTFVSSLATDVGSSIGYVINQLNYELDFLKNYKIATPLGLRSGGAPLPDNSEAYYGGQSLQYALESLNTLENVYAGKSVSGANGLGFDDYLDHLGVQHLDGTLNAAINAQFNIARTKLTAIGNPLSEKVLTTPAVVTDAYKELVKLLVLLKTDMPSNLGVVITYQDGDGD